MSVIMLVEDDDSIRQVTSMHIQLVGHEVLEAENAQVARQMIGEHKLDLVLLDIMMPGEDGFSLGEHLVAQKIPVIFLTAKTAVPDRVRGLRMGAEDYVLKPFEPAELIARIENVLNRHSHLDAIWKEKDLKIDFESRRLWKENQEIILTTMEFDLLAKLIQSHGTAISREALLNAVWGWQYTGETRTVDVHVQRIRRKIGAEWIETVYKYGYRFREDT